MRSAILFTVLPLTFTVDERGRQFPILGEGLVWAFSGSATASWSVWYVIHRQVRQVGL